MAGIEALYTSGIYSNSSPWYLCANGDFIEPVDILQCLFPNEGRSIIGENVCFVAKLFRFQLLQDIIPTSSEYYTPDGLIDGVVSLIIMGIIVSVMMLFVRELWGCLDSRFNSITPSHKKMYVVANLSKAVLLGMLAVSPRYWFGSYRFWYDDFQMVETKRCGIIYIVTDFVALFLVPKLPKSTLFHHITTTVMAVVVTSMNLQLKGWNGLLGVAKMGVLYGLFSSAAFPVNAYLALRVVYPKAKWMPVLVKLSLCTYILCCALNWSIHVVWLFRVVSSWEFSIFPLLYMVAVYFMVNDDIVLIKWLIKRGSPVPNKQKLTSMEKETKLKDVTIPQKNGKLH